MNEGSQSETITGSTRTTGTSSTISGPGALSGKAIKRFGTLVVKGVDAIMYRRRLVQIESIFQEDSNTVTDLDLKARKLLYSDLLELCRSVYNVSIRIRAFRIIMHKIGRKDSGDLATTIMYKEARTMPDIDAPQDDNIASSTSYYYAGLDAYGHDTRTFAPHVEISPAVFRIPFLISLHLMVSLSTNPTFARVLLGLGILEFIIETSFQEVGPLYEDSGESLLQAVLEKLNRTQDIHSISRIQNLVNYRVQQAATNHASKVTPLFEKEVGLEPLGMTIVQQRLAQIGYNLQQDTDIMKDLNLKAPKPLSSDLLGLSRHWILGARPEYLVITNSS
ncbi:hypothetical protein BDP27DRAFT_1337165, partial [Rhodocollybia butyracea]